MPWKSLKFLKCLFERNTWPQNVTLGKSNWKLLLNNIGTLWTFQTATFVNLSQFERTLFKSNILHLFVTLDFRLFISTTFTETQLHHLTRMILLKIQQLNQFRDFLVFLLVCFPNKKSTGIPDSTDPIFNGILL